MHKFKKIIILIIIQTFLLSNSLYAGNISIFGYSKAVESTLSPQLVLDRDAFQGAYSIYVNKTDIGDGLILPQGLIDFSDIQKEQDKQIEKTKKFDFKFNRAAFILSVFLIMFLAQNLFAAEHAVFNSISDFSFTAVVLSSLAGLAGIFSVISPVKPVFPVASVKQEQKETPRKSVKTKNKDITRIENNISLSDQAKLLSANYALLTEINNLTNEKNEAYFSLKNRADGQEHDFVIRPLKSLEEAYAFENLLKNDKNFDWVRIFNMMEQLKKLPKNKPIFCLYGVFALDEFGREKRIVAAADYIIREINGKIVLNGLHIEVLPEARKAYSGIGKTLSTKIVADTFINSNFSQTQGRVYFSAENKGKVGGAEGFYRDLFGKANDPASFYKNILGFNSNMKKTANGQLEETNEFELSLEDSLEFLKREFQDKQFSTEFKIKTMIIQPLIFKNSRVAEILETAI